MALPINPANQRGSNVIEGKPLTFSDEPVARKVGDQGLKSEDFMKLLIAQLQNQDPQSPVDTKELVTQLSQLTGVQQLTAMAGKLDTLTAAMNGMAANESAGLIGKKVEANGNIVHLDAMGGTTTAVNFRQNAAKVSVSVMNEAGRIVRTIDMPPQQAGVVSVAWDGMSDNLERAAPGTYTLTVTAKDGNNNPVNADMKVAGVVSGVSYEHGAPELVLGTTRVPLSSVTSIGQ